jgi:hypothetical protein
MGLLEKVIADERKRTQNMRVVALNAEDFERTILKKKTLSTPPARSSNVAATVTNLPKTPATSTSASGISATVPPPPVKPGSASSTTTPGGAKSATTMSIPASTTSSSSNPSAEVKALPKANALSRIPAKPVCDPAWSKVLDEETGEYYYYNSDTDESAWDCPAGLGRTFLSKQCSAQNFFADSIYSCVNTLINCFHTSPMR